MKKKKTIFNIFKRVLLILFFLNAVNVNAKITSYKDFDPEKFAEEQNHYWSNECFGENYDDCKEALLKEQKSYYKRLYKILGKYQDKGYHIDDNLIILTNFYGLTPDLFTDDNKMYKSIFRGNTPFNLGNYDVEVDLSAQQFDEYYNNYIKEEKDSIDKLVKNMFSYNSHCYAVTDDKVETEDENGTVRVTCPDGFSPTVVEGKQICAEKLKTYELSFMQHIMGRGLLSFLPGKSKDNKKDCESIESSHEIVYEVDKGKNLNQDKYFDFLIESDYFDNKYHLYPYFATTLMKINEKRDKKNEVQLISNISEEEFEEYSDEIVKSRTKIVDEIKHLLKDYKSVNPDAEYRAASGYAYWWPIGSQSLTNSGDKLFGTGDPVTVRISSPFGYRIHPIHKVRKLHAGIDIPAPKRTPIIAAKSGIVEKVVSHCVEKDPNCGGYGNYIKISHTDGNATLYAHLDKNGVAVKLNEGVDQGQVIGYMGSTGASTGSHLHFEVRIGGVTPINPLNYVSAENPRAMMESSDIEHMLKCFEGGAKYIEGDYYKVYWDLGTHGTLTVGEGVTPENYPHLFKKRGINPSDIMHAGALVPRDIVDDIFREIMDNYFTSLNTTLANNNIKLEKHQKDALISRIYNVGNVKSFPTYYKQYGNSQALYTNYMSKPVTSKGKVLQGLVKRRQIEWDLFHSGKYHTCR